MGGTKRWPLAEARVIVDGLIDILSGSCDQIAIAGSIRRGKPDVGDVELLVVSRITPGWFPDIPNDNLEQDLRLMMQEWQSPGDDMDYSCFTRRPSAKGTYTYGPKNKLLIHMPSGIPVDIFTSTPENWGRDLVIRTGPAELNIRLMARFRALGMRGHAYGPHAYTDAEGEGQDCATEEAVFAAVGWPWIPPEERE